MANREARRRRILEAGNDRLALITGRVQNLPPSSDSPDLDNISTSSPPLNSQHHDLKSLCTDSQHPVLRKDDDKKPSDHMLHRDDRAAESIQNDALGGTRREEPDIQLSRAHGFELRRKAESSRTIQGVGGSGFSVEQVLATLAHFSDYFRLNQIRSAVAASEQTRMYCSVGMAIVVILSYLGFPIVGGKILRSIILFRPLILLLVTNITFIVSWVLSEKQAGRKKPEKEGDMSPSESFGWVDEAGKALELALIVQNVMGTLLMDCSVYAVIVICFFSMAN